MTTQPEFDFIIQKQFPEIPWEKPIIITWTTPKPERFGCRFCIARLGLNKDTTKGKVFLTLEEHKKHMEKTHEVVRRELGRSSL